MIEFGRDFDHSTAAPFILDIYETKNQVLHIVLALASVDKHRSGFETYCEVVPDKGCTYEIVFEAYVLYQIHKSALFQRNGEIKAGRYFEVFLQSRLLQELHNSTRVALDTADMKWIHYGIFGQDHVIDIVSAKPPVILKRNPIHKGKHRGTSR